MTQPQPPEPTSAAPVVAVAVVGLALIAIEARVRQDVEDDIRDAFAAFAALLVIVLAAGGVVTVVELFSRPDVHGALRKTVGAAHDATVDHVTAGYLAASQLAHTKAARDLAALGYDVPDDLPTLDPSLDQILRDIDIMFGDTEIDLQNVVYFFDDDDSDVARQQAAKHAVDTVTDRLQQRAGAAATTAVHFGSRDTQQAIYTAYRNSGATVAKRWVVTASDPCGMCAALHGTAVAVDAQFDHQATTVDKDLRPVWRNLFGPPRHPNCRCQLELVTT